MRTLIIDIETRPHLGYVWSLWDQNVGLSQIVEVGSVICWAAKWRGEKKIRFMSDYHDGHEAMIEGAWELMDEADAVVHYNGRAFDMKHLRREFLLAGLGPTSPHKDIDLLTVTRSNFKFASNKLQHVASELGVGGKTQHDGFPLWVGCMEGDAKAWRTMKRYNKQDVKLTEKVYEKLRAWDKNHPNPALYSDDPGSVTCRVCQGEDFQRRGYSYTTTTKYQQLLCLRCGAWNRLPVIEGRTALRSA